VGQGPGPAAIAWAPFACWRLPGLTRPDPARFPTPQVDAIGGARHDDGAGGDNEVQRTMLEIVNQLDGFDSRGNIKARGRRGGRGARGPRRAGTTSQGAQAAAAQLQSGHGPHAEGRLQAA
jgi:hypothetical protein